MKNYFKSFFETLFRAQKESQQDNVLLCGLILDNRGTIQKLPEETILTTHLTENIRSAFDKKEPIQNIFDIPDWKTAYTRAHTSNSWETIYPNRLGPILEFHTYSSIPNHFCKIIHLSKTKLLALIYLSPMIPNLDEQLFPAFAINKKGELCSFNHSFFELFSDIHPHPSTLLGQPLERYFEVTPLAIEELKTSKEAAPNRRVIKSKSIPLKELIVSHPIYTKSGVSSLLVRPNNGCLALLTLDSEIPIHSATTLFSFEFRSPNTLPPILFLGSKGYLPGNPLTPDQAGYSLNPMHNPSVLLLKWKGWLLASSDLPQLSKGWNTIEVILSSDIFICKINNTAVFKFYNFRPLEAHRKFLSVGTRPDTEIEFRNFNLSELEPVHELSSLPIVNLLRSQERPFLLHWLANRLVRRRSFNLRIGVLNDMKPLHLKSLIEQEQGYRQSVSFVHATPHMRQIVQTALQAAKSKSTLLLTGPTGTGKDTLARLIHENSPQGGNPFILMDCSTLSESLFESTVFGHKKGAFTNAYTDNKGLLELASTGTLFINEIQNLTLVNQAKLLQTVESREARALGDFKSYAIHCRFIVATNEDLNEKVLHGTFRSDLYYRINNIVLSLPPLSERKEDIPSLVHFFLKNFSVELGRTVPAIPDASMDILKQHPWLGNVRELRNTLYSALLFSKGSTLMPEELERSFSETIKRRRYKPKARFESLVGELRKNGGDVTRAAKQAGLSRHTVYYHLKKLGINPADFRKTTQE